MAYISFDKRQLVNLEFTMNKEILRSNRSGAFYNTTIIGCNTRKYHGLLVVPQPQLDNNNHVLLSQLDETIIANKEEFHLGVHEYKDGTVAPRGHKYLREFTAEPIPKLKYRVGSSILTKEYIFEEKEPRILIRYTLEEAMQPITLRLMPFLAFRNVHMLTHENYTANRKYTAIKNGAAWQMYENYDTLCLQISKATEYTHCPMWYKDEFYIREFERGYDAVEDLYVPGFFEVAMRQGDSIVVSAGLDERNPAMFKKQFENQIEHRIPRDSFEHCLQNSAQQFIIKGEDGTRMFAGFPWFGSCSRDTFLSLPGICLARGDEKTFKELLKYMIERMQGAFFPHRYYQKNLYYTAVDSPLWFFMDLQKYESMLGQDRKTIWREYGKVVTTILESFIEGTDFNVKAHDNGLLYAGNERLALTWMNVFCDGKPWTPRTGYAIEVNALWYNALRYGVELLLEANKKNPLLKKWRDYAKRIEESFVKTFYDEKNDMFYDFVNENEKNAMVRPNMLLAGSLRYSPLDDRMKKRILDITRSELLTIRGLRSLSPRDEHYRGVTIGNHREREQAYHMGTVFPWLIMPYTDLCVRIYGKTALPYLEDLYNGFEQAIFENGIGSISEIYDGNPPHEARGCISQSTSVAALLYLNHVINYLKNDDPLYAIHHVFGVNTVNNNKSNSKDAIHRVSNNNTL